MPSYKPRMFLGEDYKPEFESLRDKLVELGQLQHVDQVLEGVVNLLAARPHVALARIWLLAAGDNCPHCAMASSCGQRQRCLHLVASAGARPHPDSPDWSQITGDYARIPIGGGKIGRVAAIGQAIIVQDFRQDPAWLARYEWAGRQGIRGLNAQPIKFKQDTLGVIAIFTLIPTPPEGPAWMRIFADQIAGAVINARNFEELERLRTRLELENAYLQEEVREVRTLGEIIGQNASVQELSRQIRVVAPTDATVLILGESGTGKELVARELHRQSQRAAQPLIRVNCASVPRELYESEFFGHVKGAFTGAIKDRAGRFEAADGGTLLLDEVGEIPLALQSKFLRVLQEQQYERVGEERTRSVDVRIIASTNRDLRREVEEGRFRQDLFYRLNVFPLHVPALRERRDDIEVLTRHFLQQAASRLRLPVPVLPPSELELLQAYNWPGNVRELQNAAERALILAQGRPLRFDLPQRLRLPSLEQVKNATITNGGSRGVSGEDEVVPILTESQIRSCVKSNTLAALNRAGWRIHGAGGAAELLGVKPTTLVSRINKLGLRKPA